MSLKWVLPGLAAYQQIRVHRAVPPDGLPTVEAGARVEPSAVVARGRIVPDVLVIDVGHALGLSAEKVANAVVVREGQQIDEGQVIAQAGRRGRTQLTAPTAGTVVGVDRTAGLVALQPLPREVEVLAGVKGAVESASSSEIVIATYGHRIYGALGLGGEAHGTIKVLSGGNPPSADSIGLQFSLSILIATVPLSADLLRKAEQARVKAVVAPSVPARELAAFLGVEARDLDPNALPTLPFPLLLTEGFGSIPMPRPLAELLESCDGHEGLLLAQQPAYSRRSSLTVCLPRARADAKNLPPGLVRLVDPTLLGKHARAQSLREGPALHDLASVCIEVDGNDVPRLVPVVDVEELSPLGS